MGVDLPEGGERLGTVSAEEGLIVLGLEHDADHLCQGGVVIDDEDPGRHASYPGTPARFTQQIPSAEPGRSAGIILQPGTVGSSAPPVEGGQPGPPRASMWS